MVDVRREDKTIREFEIPAQEFDIHFDGKVIQIDSVTAIKGHEPVSKAVNITVRKGWHVLLSGPNGIGKTTMLEKFAAGVGEGFTVAKPARIGYYKQDFSNLNFDQTAFEALQEVMQEVDEQRLRATAAGFLLDGKLLAQPIRALSEGQKGLLAFCRLALMQPGLLILDEPTNHINFRHLPIIAQALDQFQGAMIMVSHIPDFVAQIRIDETIDLDQI
jgi:ATPase subunit of ABC transporter with duplicated ATPase domains